MHQIRLVWALMVLAFVLVNLRDFSKQGWFEFIALTGIGLLMIGEKL